MNTAPDFEKDIEDFHEKFGLTYEGPPRTLVGELFVFRTKFLREELDEYIKASLEEDITKQADALVDLMYVLLGTAYLQGIPIGAIWELVHAANMKKVRAENPEDSKRGTKFDVVKPEGWVSPEPKITDLLKLCEKLCFTKPESHVNQESTITELLELNKRGWDNG